MLILSIKDFSMKKYIILATISFLAASCNQNTVSMQQTNTMSQANTNVKIINNNSTYRGTKEIIETEPDCTKTHTISTNTVQVVDLKFTTKTPWIVTYETKHFACILTESKPYLVYMLFEARKNPIDNPNDSKYDSRQVTYGEIFKVACGGGFCAGANVGSDVYEFNYSVQSTQPAPADLDGIWNPDNNITDDQVNKLLSTISKY